MENYEPKESVLLAVSLAMIMQDVSQHFFAKSYTYDINKIVNISLSFVVFIKL